jgi:hypothetical protein
MFVHFHNRLLFVQHSLVKLMMHSTLITKYRHDRFQSVTDNHRYYFVIIDANNTNYSWISFANDNSKYNRVKNINIESTITYVFELNGTRAHKSQSSTTMYLWVPSDRIKDLSYFLLLLLFSLHLLSKMKCQHCCQWAFVFWYLACKIISPTSYAINPTANGIPVVYCSCSMSCYL